MTEHIVSALELFTMNTKSLGLSPGAHTPPGVEAQTPGKLPVIRSLF